MTPEETIDAFARMVDHVESAAGRRSQIEIARASLQGLRTSLTRLAPEGDFGDAVAAAIAVVHDWVQEQAGGVDDAEGEALRTKVAAYAVLADDLEIDPARPTDLVRRWDIVTAPAGPATRASGGAAKASRTAVDETNLTECPICHNRYKRIRMHYTQSHKGETPPV